MSSAIDKERRGPALGWVSGRHQVAITAVLSVVIGYLVAHWPTLSVAATVVLVLSIGVVWSRGFALGAILTSSLVMLSVIAWFGLPARVGLVTKALIGLFVLTVLLDLGGENRLRVPKPMIALVAVLAVSAVVSPVSTTVAIYATALILAAPIAFLAVVHSSITISSLRRVALVVVGLAAVQVPIVLVQSRYLSHVDLMGGTFGDVGGTHVQSIVMGLAWTAAVALLFGPRRVWLLPVGLGVATVLLVSEAKAGFVFAVVGTVVVGLANAVVNPRHGMPTLMKYGIIAAAAAGTLFGAYLFLGDLLPGGQQSASAWVAFLTNPTAVRDYLFSYDTLGNAGRLEGTRLVLAQPSTLVDLLIGRGTGLLTQAGLLGQSQVSSSASMSGALDRATSMTRSLYENGVLGMLVYVASIGSAVFAVARAWASRTDELDVAVTAAAAGAAAVYFVASFYYIPWTVDAVAVPFWCLMGMAVKWGQLRTAERQHLELAESS